MPTYKLRQSEGGSFLDQLLNSRGIVSDEEREAFLNPSYTAGTHDPFLLKDMDKAVRRIVDAVEKNEHIVIYSDFDADGIPGGVVLHDFFKRIGYQNFENYIPHRHKEGFGVHVAALESVFARCMKEAAESGDEGKEAKLFITIDCGITDVDAAVCARRLGFDLIITDHHTPAEVLPDAFAIINPKQPGCEYPEKMLCGAGVIYKVIQALCAAQRNEAGEVGREGTSVFNISEGWEKWLLDLVGLATLSDMVPLRGENRTFAHFGLMVMRKTRRIGLIKLFKALKMEPKFITEEDIAFMITPRINAASRMADPKDAFILLSTESETEAEEMVKHLNAVNDSRKTQVAHLVKQIKKVVEERGLHEKPLIVLGNPDWKPPVLGLAATHIVREYNRPVYLWGRAGEDFEEDMADQKNAEEVIKGSCRAPDGFDAVRIMRNVPSDFFINVGGHSAAGGFALSGDKVHTFEETLLDSFAKLTAVDESANAENGNGAADSTASEDGEGVDLPGTVYIDKILFTDEVGRSLWSTIEKMGPFGEANPKPVFVLKDVTVLENKLFGKTKEHVELTLLHATQGRTGIKAIQFFAADDKKMTEKAVSGAILDIVAHMEKSMFRGFPEYRLRIIDIL
ncbi:MAG TPA: DHH family phosphoesterase [Candidatus Paceibacterota bacterium]